MTWRRWLFPLNWILAKACETVIRDIEPRPPIPFWFPTVSRWEYWSRDFVRPKTYHELVFGELQISYADWAFMQRHPGKPTDKPKAAGKATLGSDFTIPTSEKE